MYEGTGSWSKFNFQMQPMEIARKEIPRINIYTAIKKSIPASGKSADKESEGTRISSEPSICSLHTLRKSKDQLGWCIALVGNCCYSSGSKKGKVTGFHGLLLPKIIHKRLAAFDKQIMCTPAPAKDSGQNIRIFNYLVQLWNKVVPLLRLWFKRLRYNLPPRIPGLYFTAQFIKSDLFK